MTSLALKRLTLPVVLTDDFDDLPIPFRAVAADVATGEAVVIDSGDLASAMRASMSVPGIFKPARRNGRLLVDGGVANNLPVQIVRDMGADVLIVVDVGSPLRDEEQLGSALAVTKQMLRLLIHDRARDQAALLTTADILISPELGGLGSRDFLRAVEAQESGKERARELSSRLAELSVSSEEYLAHRQRLEQRRHGTPYIDRVVVETGSSLSPKVIAARLAEQEGKLLDLDQLESDISDIYGFDTFETVSWNVLEKTDGTTLVVRATEKSWGPNYLRFGINLEDDFEGESNYSLAVRFTRTEINKKGGELRAEIQMGATLRLFAELYQPLDFASRWFVNPQIETQRTSSGIFDDRGLQIARLGSVDATVSLAGGRQFGNRSEFRLGVTRARGRSKRLIGPPLVEGQSIHLTNLTASFEHDTIDRVAVPRSGTSAKLSWFGFRENLGSDLTFDATQLRFLKPQTWGDHTVLHWWNLGRTANDRTPGIRPFELGGLFNLSGYASGELAGSHAGIGRLLYYHRLRGQLLSALGTQIYLGASIEAGNVWQSADAVEWNNTLSAGSVFVVFDSPLGPLYFAYGAAEGGRQSAYLFLGQTF
jgi:NTE family protein